MLTDYEDDFFYEEDKILTHNMEIKSDETIKLLIFEDEDNCVEPSSSSNNRLVVDDSLQKNDINIITIEDLNDVDEIETVQYSGYYSDEHKSNYSLQKFELERLGMTVSSDSVVIKKDPANLIGISIGGGAPFCPCLYIVQVFDGTPAALDGSLQSGDELTGINGVAVKGKTKVEVAKMIQTATDQVTINYNKLHADPTQGESLDIIVKKIKHRLVEAMSSTTADTLGLSRAILCNDSLVKRLSELEGTEQMYKSLVEHSKRMLKAYFDLFQTLLSFGNEFAAISVREPQPRASEAFRLFGEVHRNMEKDGIKMLKYIKPVLNDMGTYLHKAIPDTKLTIRRYADAKFTYLSYCLKVKEMDDEEHSYAAQQEPLYRVETGNYEYRLILRCRQDARNKFAKLRNDVLEKMELLECKHSRDLCEQLKRFIEGLGQLGTDNLKHLTDIQNLFPIEVDLKETAFQYKSVGATSVADDYDDDEEDDNNVEEATEYGACGGELISGLENINLTSSDIKNESSHSDNNIPIPSTSKSETDVLLAELGLADIDLSAGQSNFKNFDLLQ